MWNTWFMTAMAMAALAGERAHAEPKPFGCPQPVVDAIVRPVPSSTITACKAAPEHDRDLFEGKVTKADRGKLEIDVAPDGAIQATFTEDGAFVDEG